MKSDENINTPYFLINVDRVDNAVNEISHTLKSRWKEGIIGYSFKTNNLPWIIEYMKSHDIWAEVVSSDEYLLAKQLGYKAEKIIFNGPVKGKDEFIDAVENGAIINIDSKRELYWLLDCDRNSLDKATIGLRVNFCIEDYCPEESQCGSEDGRFGFSYEMGELKKAIDFFVENSITLSGLHLHCSSKTRSINIYNAISKIAVEIIEKYSLHLKYIDIGGGYFGGVPNKPTFDDYFNVIKNNLNSSYLTKNVNLIIEPGMSIIGANIDYITSVVDIKNTKNNCFVITDGSRIHIDPLMKKSSYSFKIERNSDSESNAKPNDQILCGFTCMECDRFFHYSDVQLGIGDKICFEKVGAYTMGLSPQFIEFYPSVYANFNGKLMLVRSKGTAEKFIN